MLRRIYDWTMALAAHPRASWALGAIAFIESSVFPVPPDAMLAPMVLANRERAWRYALICTLASVAGGIAGYAIGYYLFDAIGQPILDLYGQAAAFTKFQSYYQEHGAWIVSFAGLTPFPYKVITIASGVAQLDLATFFIASTASRGLRFLLVAALLWYAGPAIRNFVERRLGWVTAAFFVVLLGGFVLIKYLH